MTNYNHFICHLNFLKHLPNTLEKERNFVTGYYAKKLHPAK